MKKMIRLAMVSGLAVLMLTAFMTAASAEDWPTKTITLIYHSKAGSGGDLFLRALAKPLEKELGQSVIVENKPGAGGMNAWKPAAEARDNHTFLGVSSTIITAPILNKMPVNYKSFKPVAMMFVDPMILFVKADAPWNTLQEFIADAKKNPGKYNIAGGVPGELGFVAGMLLMQKAGIKINIVPFEAGSDAAVSVLGGHIDGAIGEYAEAAGPIEAGQLKVLAAYNPIAGTDIPTMKEAGVDISVQKFRGILAPKTMPQAIIDKMAEACKEAQQDPGFKAYYEKMKLVPVFKTGDAFTKVMADQDARIREFLNE